MGTDGALLALKDADLETCVLWSFEDFVAMEAVERLGCVCARDSAVGEVGAAPWVEVGEAGEIVYLCVYDDPLRRVCPCTTTSTSTSAPARPLLPVTPVITGKSLRPPPLCQTSQKNHPVVARVVVSCHSVTVVTLLNCMYKEAPLRCDVKILYFHS